MQLIVKHGVFKANSIYGVGVNSSTGYLYSNSKTYNDYINGLNNLFISKGTLENVITGKQLINQTQLEESQETQDEEIEALQTENERLKAT